MSESLQRINAEIRETPLAKRLAESCDRISRMCAAGRPPSMSIPVRATDDDFYITTTIKDAADEIGRLTAEVAECKKPTQWTYHGDYGDNDVVDSPDDMADGLEVGDEFELTPWRQIGPPVKFTSQTDANGCAYAKIVEAK